jgi:hypothetical protein
MYKTFAKTPMQSEAIQLRDMYKNARRQSADSQMRGLFSQLPRGRASITRLLAEIADAHESVLSAALPSGANNGQTD